MSELIKGDPCWVYRDDEVTYEIGSLASLDAKSASVKLKSGKTITCEPGQVLKANKEKQDGESDNTFLRELNEATILHNVGVRYAKDDGGCYTTTGHILIAVNPFRELKIYDESQVRARARAIATGAGESASACSPLGARRRAPHLTPSAWPTRRSSATWDGPSAPSRRTSMLLPTACTGCCCRRARARRVTPARATRTLARCGAPQSARTRPVAARALTLCPAAPLSA